MHGAEPSVSCHAVTALVEPSGEVTRDGFINAAAEHWVVYTAAEHSDQHRVAHADQHSVAHADQHGKFVHSFRDLLRTD
jgi:hypothetical protein